MLFFFFLLKEHFAITSWNTFLAIFTLLSFLQFLFTCILGHSVLTPPVHEALLILLQSFFFLLFSWIISRDQVLGSSVLPFAISNVLLSSCSEFHYRFLFRFSCRILCSFSFIFSTCLLNIYICLIFMTMFSISHYTYFHQLL